MKILHVIGSLDVAGAQMMLARLLAKMDQKIFSQEVISLTNAASLGGSFVRDGIPTRCLGIGEGTGRLTGFLRLAKWIRESGADLVQTWVYHSDLFGGLAARLAGTMPVVWGIHSSNVDPRYQKRGTLRVIRACARLCDWLPARIVCCSESARRLHADLGYLTAKMVVIPNGFDTAHFKPDAAARHSVRAELGISDDAFLIGCFARFHPIKDHRTLIRAAGGWQSGKANVHYLLGGDGISPENSELAGWIHEAGIGSQCHLVGPRSDMPRLMGALDVITLPSRSEALPNVLGEAMACGIPVVATDVGDVRILVGNAGRLVPPADPSALADGWRILFEMEPDQRRQMGAWGRTGIEERFSLSAIVRRYETLYREVIADVRDCRNS